MSLVYVSGNCVICTRNTLLLCSLLLSIIHYKAAENFQNDSDWFSQNTSQSRRKRSSPLLRYAAREGDKAVQQLLSRAEEIPSNTYKFKRFRKPGGWETALIDFRSLPLTNVIEYGGRRFARINMEYVVGRVGDRNFVLKKRGRFGKPSIEVMKLTPRYPYHLADIISYVD